MNGLIRLLFGGQYSVLDQTAGGFIRYVFILGFIADIVLTVIVYRRHIRRPRGERLNYRNVAALHSFINFDTLVIETVTKVFYVFFTLLLAVCMLCCLLFAMVVPMGLSFIQTILLILAIIVTFLLMGVFLRLLFESCMLRVITARNTTRIRSMMEGESTLEQNPQEPIAAADVPTAPVEPTPQTPAPAEAPPAYEAGRDNAVTAPPAQVVPPQPQEAEEVLRRCPTCHETVDESAKFCRHCGERLS